ncbi:MAG: hypothetical protein HND57_05575 [Planctomycetes bacterium]|nr:hypothetical protein [Planctomycetota bacterium]
MIDQQNPLNVLDTDLPLLSHRRLLGARLYLHCLVRLAVGITIAVGALFARYVVNVESLSAGELVAVGIGILLYDALAFVQIRHRLSPDPSLDDYVTLKRVMYGAILLDYLALTAAIWLVGGARSPFLAFYLLHVILSCVLLSPRAALGLTGVAYLLMVSLTLLEWTGLAPPRLPAGAVPSTVDLNWQYALTLLVVYGLLLGLIALLMITLASALRRSETHLYDANSRLERLSQMRRDFLHIALHNLKSPIGAATMLLGNIRDGLGGPTTDQQQQWLDRSLNRLDGLTSFIRDLQVLATLDSGLIGPQAKPIDIKNLLASLVDEYQDLANQKSHRLTLEAESASASVLGIERLIKEALVNYITNAIKYTPDGGTITVRSAVVEAGKTVRVDVTDNGIGIDPTDQSRLFGEFVRLKPSAPSISAEGSGLGLSIVKRVIEAHGGTVGVKSTPGAGSTFFVQLPIAEAADPAPE